MADKIGGAGGAKPLGPKATTPAPSAKPAAPHAVATAIHGDAFLSAPPNAEQLKQFRADVAALDALPKRPKGIEEQKAWLEQVTPAWQKADRAASAIHQAEFFHKAVPRAEADAAQDKAGKLFDQIRDAEQAVGWRKPDEPANPLRPLFGLTGGAKDWLGSGNPFKVLPALLLFPVALVVDAADAVSRPIQAIAWPAEKIKQEVREKRYEKEHPPQ